MKEFIKTLLMAGVPFGVIMGVFYSFSNGVYGGIFGGVLSGLLFGLLLGIFALIQKRKFKKTSFEITNGKSIIMDGGANHFKGAEGVGGWLFLSPDELIFKSHSFNMQNHQTVIPLKQISKVETILTLGLIPNGLHITTHDGNKERFVVNNRKVWVKRINEAIYSVQD